MTGRSHIFCMCRTSSDGSGTPEKMVHEEEASRTSMSERLRFWKGVIKCWLLLVDFCGDFVHFPRQPTKLRSIVYDIAVAVKSKNISNQRKQNVYEFLFISLYSFISLYFYISLQLFKSNPEKISIRFTLDCVSSPLHVYSSLRPQPCRMRIEWWKRDSYWALRTRILGDIVAVPEFTVSQVISRLCLPGQKHMLKWVLRGLEFVQVLLMGHSTKRKSGGTTLGTILKNVDAIWRFLIFRDYKIILK